jgi:tetratricopeptide (TPR) repeat protein
MTRRLNGKVVAYSALTLVLVGTCVHFLHAFQSRRNAGALINLANSAEQAGNLVECADHLNRYLAFAPGDTDAMARYGLVLDKVAKTRQSRWRVFAVLEKVLRLDPARNDVRRQLVRIAMLPDLDRIPDASEHLNTLIKAFPADGELEQLLARCEERQGKYEKAVACLDRAIQKHSPTIVECYSAKATLLRQHFDNAKAADRAMDEMVKTHPTFQAFLARAQYYKRNGAGDKAAKDLAEARRLAPDEPDVLLEAAQAAADGKNFDDGRSCLERGMRLYPQDLRFGQALVRLEIRADRRPAAIACLRKSLANASRKPEDLWALADLLIDVGEVEGPEGAREMIANLRAAGMTAAPMAYLDARILIAQGRWLEGKELLERTRPRLLRSPDLTKQADWFLGQCYEHLGNPDEEVVALRRAIGLDHLWEPARRKLAAALVNLGRLDEAIENYRALPDARLEVARLLVYRNLRVAPPRRRWAEVEEILDAAARARPDSVEVTILRAQMLAGQSEQRIPEARQLLLTARAKYPKEVRLWSLLAELAERENHPDQAVSILNEARRRLPDGVELRLAHARYWSRRGGADAAKALVDLENNVDKFSAKDQDQLLGGLAEAHYYNGSAQQAERLWSVLAGRQPNNLRLQLLLFDLALQEGKKSRLESLLSHIRVLEGEEGDLWRFGEAAREVAQAKRGEPANLDRARSRLNEVASRRPSWARVSLLQGELNELAGDADHAIDNYQEAIRLGDRNPDVIRRVVELLCTRHRYVEADLMIQKLPEQTPITGTFGRIAAEVSLFNQDAERALKLALNAVSTTSKDYHDHLWLGQILGAVGRLEEAEKTLRYAQTMAPDMADPWVALIQFLARTGQVEKAKTTVQEVQLVLGSGLPAVALAQCYEAISQMDRAEEQYQRALQAKPNDVTVLRKVADFYLRQGRPKQAEPHLRRLIDPAFKAPQSDVAWARRGWAILLAADSDYRRFHEALRLIDQNSAIDPKSIDDLRARALILATRLDQRREAIRLFEEVFRREPPTAEEQFILAQLYERNDNRKKARERMLSLLAANEDQPKYLAFQVRLLIDWGSLTEAQFWLVRLEKAAPEAFETLQLRTGWLQKRGRNAEAIALVQDYLHKPKADPALAAPLLEMLGQVTQAEELYRGALVRDTGPERLLALIHFLGRQRRVGQALDLCRQAWLTCPPETVSRACMSVLRAGQADQGQRELVRAWIEAAIQKNPHQLALLLDLAELNDLEARYRDAQESYRQVLQQDRSSIVALNNLAWLVNRDGDHAQALALVNEAVERVGPGAELLDTRAVIYLSQGRPAQAIADLEEAIAQTPSAVRYFHLAQACLLAQKQGAAREAMQQARSAGLKPHQLHPLERPAYDQMLASLKSS